MESLASVDPGFLAELRVEDDRVIRTTLTEATGLVDPAR